MNTHPLGVHCSPRIWDCWLVWLVVLEKTPGLGEQAAGPRGLHASKHLASVFSASSRGKTVDKDPLPESAQLPWAFLT